MSGKYTPTRERTSLGYFSPAEGVQERSETMELHEMLKLCLLALDSRFPESIIEVNGTLLGHPGFWGEACPPTAMLEVLRLHAPELLLAPACLVIVQGQSAIYLAERLEREPAFWVYCEGCTPSQRAKQLEKQVARMAIV
jgi:hypothetical protein